MKSGTKKAIRRLWNRNRVARKETRIREGNQNHDNNNLYEGRRAITALVLLANSAMADKPGTQLKVISKNANGSLHVQAGKLVTDAPVSAVTNDLDIARGVWEQARKAYMPTPTPGDFLSRWP